MIKPQQGSAMSRQRLNTDYSRVKRLLLVEEFHAERVIGVFKTILFTGFTALTVVLAVTSGTGFLTDALPPLVVWAAAVSLLLPTLIMSDRVGSTGRYYEPLKYLHIAIDVAMFALVGRFVFLFLIRTLSLTEPAAGLIVYTALFLLGGCVLIVVSLFRLHPYAVLMTGILWTLVCAVVGYTIPLFSSLFTPGGLEFGSTLFTAITLGLYLTGIFLATLVAGRVRRVVLIAGVRDRLARFLPDTVTRAVLEQGVALPESGEKRKVTILAVGIRGFAELAESLPPDEVIALLNGFVKDITDTVLSSGGVIDRAVGDSVTALFGAPFPSELDAGNAVRAAISMCRTVETANELRKAHKLSPLKIGIGIHSGSVVLGSVGPAERNDFTALGGTVTTAKRLEKLTKKVPARIIISETTWIKLGREFSATPLGTATVHGGGATLKLYSVNPWGSQPERPLTEV